MKLTIPVICGRSRIACIGMSRLIAVVVPFGFTHHVIRLDVHFYLAQSVTFITVCITCITMFITYRQAALDFNSTYKCSKCCLLHCFCHALCSAIVFVYVAVYFVLFVITLSNNCLPLDVYFGYLCTLLARLSTRRLLSTCITLMCDSS
jgi:hypothetical protein